MPDGTIKLHPCRRPGNNLRCAGRSSSSAQRSTHRGQGGAEALQQAQAELAHVTRVTTMGELTASIAHEVNQPFAGIITHGEASLRWLDRAQPDLGEVRRASSMSSATGAGRRGHPQAACAGQRAELSRNAPWLDELLEDTLTSCSASSPATVGIDGRSCHRSPWCTSTGCICSRFHQSGPERHPGHGRH